MSDNWTMLPFGMVHNSCFESKIKRTSEDLSLLSLSIQDFDKALQDFGKALLDATENYASILYSIASSLGEAIEVVRATRREAKIVRRKERHYRMTHGKHGLKRPK